MKYQENIVPAWEQNKGHFFANENTGIRILFVGNSITKHAPKESIGWYRDCGMAASALEKDYVHLLMQKVKQYDKNAAYAIAQVAEYERRFMEVSPEDMYQEAADFRADIVIMFFGANVSKDYDALPEDERKALPVTFGQAFEALRNLVSNNGTAKVFVSEGFYVRPLLEREKRQVCEKYKDCYISLGDIGEKDETHGMFNHPNDEGMREIAERFWEYIEPILNTRSE